MTNTAGGSVGSSFVEPATLGIRMARGGDGKRQVVGRSVTPDTPESCIPIRTHIHRIRQTLVVLNINTSTGFSVSLRG